MRNFDLLVVGLLIALAVLFTFDLVNTKGIQKLAHNQQEIIKALKDLGVVFKEVE